MFNSEESVMLSVKYVKTHLYPLLAEVNATCPEEAGDLLEGLEDMTRGDRAYTFGLQADYALERIAQKIIERKFDSEKK